MLATIVKGDVQGTVLDRAERAWAERDYELLASAARGIADICGQLSYLVEPLVVVSNLLATNPHYVSQAIAAAQAAAKHAPASSPIEETAVTAWRRHIARLPTPVEQASAVETVFTEIFPQSESRLYQQASGVWDECLARAEPAQQVDAAKKLLKKRNIPLLRERAVSALWRNIDNLANTTEKANAALHVAWYAETGSERYHEGVAAWERHVAAMLQPIARLAAINEAARRTHAQSDLYTHIIEAWEKHIEMLPEAEQRVQTASDTNLFGVAEKAAAIILANVDALDSPELRAEAAWDAFISASDNSEIQEQAITAWLKYIDDLADPLQRISAATRSAKSSVNLMRNAGVTTVLKHIHHEQDRIKKTKALELSVRVTSENSSLGHRAIAAWSRHVSSTQHSFHSVESARGLMHLRRPAARQAAAAVMIEQEGTLPNAQQRFELLQTAMRIARARSLTSQRAVKKILAEIPGLPREHLRISAASEAALYANDNSPREQQAITIWSQQVALLQMTSERISAALEATRISPHDSSLARQAISDWETYVTGLQEPSERFYAARGAAQVRPLHPVLSRLSRNIIFTYIDGLPNAEDRVEAARVASWGNINKGIKSDAIAAWSRHMQAIEEPDQVLRAITNASGSSGFGMDDNYILRRMALDAWPAFVARIPQPTRRVSVALAAIKDTKPRTSLEDQLFNVWRQQVGALAEPSQRVEAAKAALGSPIPATYVLEKVLDYSSELTESEQRSEAALFVYQQTNDGRLRTRAATAWKQAVESQQDITACLNSAVTVGRIPGAGEDIKESAAFIILKRVDALPSLNERVQFIEIAIALGGSSPAGKQANGYFESLSKGYIRPSRGAATAFLQRLRPA